MATEASNPAWQNRRSNAGAKRCGHRRRALRWAAGLGCAMLAMFGVTPALRAADSLTASDAPGSNIFRIAFSTTIMSRINQNDARAAVKAWAENLIRERGIPGTAESSILDRATLIEAFRNKRLHCAVLTTPEVLELGESHVSRLFVGAYDGEPFEEYILLARRTSGAQRLADLRGKRLMILDHYRTVLARPWLDTALAEAGLPLTADFFGSITLRDKPSNVVLPVFFGTADACLVTRRGFNVMVELNPQVGKQLTEIAASPRLVAVVCCVNFGFHYRFETDIIDAMLHLPDSTTGNQILTVFQFGALVERPPSCLETARGLLAQHARLLHPPGSARTMPPTPASEPGAGPVLAPVGETISDPQ